MLIANERAIAIKTSMTQKKQKPFHLTQFGNSILRKRQKRVPNAFLGAQSFRTLVKKMFFTLHHARGVGLAAPQIGKDMALAVIEVKKTKLRPDVVPLKKTVIVNPKIISYSRVAEYDWEGCLSLKDVRGLVPRAKEITVEYRDGSGKKIIKKLEGFQARVFQHEIDHLNGILYVDRMDDMRTLITKEELEKRI